MEHIWWLFIAWLGMHLYDIKNFARPWFLQSEICILPIIYRSNMVILIFNCVDGWAWQKLKRFLVFEDNFHSCETHFAIIIWVYKMPLFTTISNFNLREIYSLWQGTTWDMVSSIGKSVLLDRSTSTQVLRVEVPVRATWKTLDLLCWGTLDIYF